MRNIFKTIKNNYENVVEIKNMIKKRDAIN